MFKITTNETALKETSSNGSSFINKSGVYDIVINFASLSESKNGAKNINFNYTYKDNEGILYGPYYQKTDGSANEVGASLYNKLGIIAGLTEGDSFTIVEEIHKVGKEGKEQSFEVIEELSDLPVKVFVQFEYSMYNGEIQERKNIRSFYRAEDSATAEEIVKGEGFGEQLALVEEKYADNVTYNDGLTEEDVQEWLKARRENKGTKGPAKKTGSPKRAKAAGPIFK